MARLRAAGCVYADQEATLLREAVEDPVEVDRLVAARVTGTPLEHLLGWAAFAGLRVRVTPGVFVPRRRTELLVTEAVRAITARGADATVVDLCCGSGAVAAAVLSRVGAEVHAADVDPVAVACARTNLPRQRVHQGDLYDALPGRLRGRIDVLTANAPYVPHEIVGTLPVEARDHEPRSALDGGRDGLDVHRRIMAGAPAWLSPAGVLLLETSALQARDDVELMSAAGFAASVVSDPVGGGTVIHGRLSRPARPAV